MASRVHKLRHPVTVSELAHALELPWAGNDAVLESVASTSSAEPGCICFSVSEVAREFEGSAVVAPALGGAGGAILSQRPRFDFIRLLRYLQTHIGFSRAGAAPYMHSTVSLGRNAFVGDDCVLAEGVVIEPNAVIHDGTHIGAFTRIRANANVGGDGFGFERVDSGELLRFPHLGGVRIGSHVEIGAGACVARGSLDDTVVEDQVKIDNLVQIAHNCHLAVGVMVVSGSSICGGVHIGKDAWIGPAVSIIQNIEIGEGAVVGMGSVVIRSVEAYSVVAGNPARFLKWVGGKE